VDDVTESPLSYELDRIREIGREIAALTDESRDLRNGVFISARALAIPGVPETESDPPCRFIIGNTVVTLRVSGKEKTVTFENLPVVGQETAQ